MNHQEMIDVIQAHKDGATIQTGTRQTPWVDVANNKPSWNFTHFNYRVKPVAPREVFIVDIVNGGLGSMHYENPSLVPSSSNYCYKIVKFREVAE